MTGAERGALMVINEDIFGEMPAAQLPADVVDGLVDQGYIDLYAYTGGEHAVITTAGLQAIGATSDDLPVPA